MKYIDRMIPVVLLFVVFYFILEAGDPALPIEQWDQATTDAVMSLLGMAILLGVGIPVYIVYKFSAWFRPLLLPRPTDVI